MNKLVKTLLPLSASLFIATGAHATIIDHGTYLTDTTSGLDWLDLTYTVNQSYDQALTRLAPTGDLYGWRVANGTQFIGLYNNSRLPTPATFDTNPPIGQVQVVTDDAQALAFHTLMQKLSITQNT